MSVIPTENQASAIPPTRWWHAEDDRIICNLCPRECSLAAGDRGFCFVRQNIDQQMVLTTYGRSTGFCIDPIEKKPLNHFYPGTSVLSFGTAGCNLGCKFCQNWSISKSREVEALSQYAGPEDIAQAAKSLGCASVAYTYNDPIIWAEYAMETARACRAAGVKSVAVTAGYISPEARQPFFEYMDAANVDLKAFTEEFYYRVTLSHLQPVLDTLRWLKHESDVWFEITNLVIPDANDGHDELRRMCDWVLNNVGDEVPVHFTAFHPDFRMRDRANTSHDTLIQARSIAQETGLKYVYVGNVHDVERQSTYCPQCQTLLIERDWHELGVYALQQNRCSHCRHAIAGRFDRQPGSWGRKRQPIDMRQFTQSPAHAANARPQPAATAQSAGRTDLPVIELSTTPGGSQTVSTIPLSIELTDEQERVLLNAAGELVEASVVRRRAVLADTTLGGLAEQTVAGVFVTLKRNGRLRGCRGSFGAAVKLATALADAAASTATDDPRFPPVTLTELPHLDVDVWLLCAMEQVTETGAARIAAVEVGRHGLQIIHNGKRGLLLPGVAVDHGWQAEEFLNQVSIKAGLPPSAWKQDTATLLRFQGTAVEGRLPVSDALPDVAPLFSPQQVTAYQQYARGLVFALASGATPNYYFTEVSDSNVSGAAVVLLDTETGQSTVAARVSLRQTMPLQSTFFSLAEELVRSLQRARRLNNGLDQYQVDIAIFTAPALHGTVAAPDLSGIESARQCVLVAERGKTAWVFDTELSPTELLSAAADQAGLSSAGAGEVYSLHVLSSAPRLNMAVTPRPAAGSIVRPPAVAGTFYPSDAAELTAQLQSFLAGDCEKKAWPAAMTPHAGWRYSGQLATDVLRRIELPSTVIILSPKHTPQGVDWAVAPNQTWSLPNGHLETNRELAEALVNAIPNLQFDAAAHEREHGIEVELPIIAHLAPATRIVGITIGSGDLERCQQFADGLASVLKDCDERPLLLISSDMNHFADDKENRRLDELALTQLDQLDANQLLHTVRENHISMCGVLPAVIVLKTLQQLGGLHAAHRVGYGTSADTTGDHSRVVGYAGMLFE